MCGNGEPTAGGSALWKIHPHPSAILSMETVTLQSLTQQPGATLTSLFLPVQKERLQWREARTQLSLHNLGFVSVSDTEVVKLKKMMFQCLNPCAYFPRCIWCLFGPFLDRKPKRPRHLQGTLRNEPSAAGLSLSAIIQESHATPRGAILIKLETAASLSTQLQRQPFSYVYCRHILPGTLSKHNSILQINTQQ